MSFDVMDVIGGAQDGIALGTCLLLRPQGTDLFDLGCVGHGFLGPVPSTLSLVTPCLLRPQVGSEIVQGVAANVIHLVPIPGHRVNQSTHCDFKV